MVAADAERQKHALYDESCEREGTTMIPFVMESYGGIGKEGRKLLLRLADQAEETTAQRALAQISDTLSVALQRGNAEIAAKGTQRLRVQQHRDSETGMSMGRRLPSRRQQQQHQKHQHQQRHVASQQHSGLLSAMGLHADYHAGGGGGGADRRHGSRRGASSLFGWHDGV